MSPVFSRFCFCPEPILAPDFFGTGHFPPPPKIFMQCMQKISQPLQRQFASACGWQFFSGAFSPAGNMPRQGCTDHRLSRRLQDGATAVFPCSGHFLGIASLSDTT